jgi:hypothetical protein
LIPYVRPEILSTEELSAKQSGNQPISARSSDSQTYSMNQPSPLATYIQEKGLSQEQLNEVAQSLLDASLAAQRGASRIAELQERFPSAEQLDSQAHANLQSLLATYSKSITDGLDAEEATLGQIGIASSKVREGQSVARSFDPATIRKYIHENQMLCEELIAGSSGSTRSAVAIASDLQLSIIRIRAALTAEQKQSL